MDSVPRHGYVAVVAVLAIAECPSRTVCMNAADRFVRALEQEGVTHAFGVPGEENLDLMDALRTSNIDFITTRHERAAAFMAAAYGRLTGKAGVRRSTLVAGNESGHGDSLRPARRHARGHHYRPEAHQAEHAGAVSAQRRGRHDAAHWRNPHTASCTVAPFRHESARRFAWPNRNARAPAIWNYRKTLPANTARCRWWRLHDELARIGDRRAPAARSDGPDPQRGCLQHDQVEAAGHGIRRLRTGLRQSGLRRQCRSLRCQRLSSRSHRPDPAVIGAIVPSWRRAPDRGGGRLLPEQPDPQSRHSDAQSEFVVLYYPPH